MDPRKNMIIDLEKKGDKRMFVTEQVVHISENNNGLWAVKFSTSQHIFNYNKSRLLYLKNPTCTFLHNLPDFLFPSRTIL